MGIKAVSFVRNELSGNEVGKQRAIPKQDQEHITIPCDLLLRSIGYKPVPLPGLTLQGNKLLNDGLGRVCTKEKNTSEMSSNNSETSISPIPRLYVAGWLKRGPNGIINSNIVDARNTVHAIIEDLSSVKESIASEETFESEST